MYLPVQSPDQIICISERNDDSNGEVASITRQAPRRYLLVWQPCTFPFRIRGPLWYTETVTCMVPTRTWGKSFLNVRFIIGGWFSIEPVQEHPEVGSLFKNPAALEWLDAISQSNSILSTTLAVMHQNYMMLVRRPWTGWDKMLRSSLKISSARCWDPASRYPLPVDFRFQRCLCHIQPPHTTAPGWKI